MSKLCLIDAHSLCYRAFFAIKTGLVTSYGQPTNAVYGFVNMLNRIIDDVNPQYAAICFDTAKPTFREEKFKEYKINRLPMPDDLKTQMPIIKEIISAYNLNIIEKDGFEADDIISAVSHKAKQGGFQVVIVTSDKDMLQLVDNEVKVYNPYRKDTFLLGAKEVEEQFGVKPENIVDLLSLMGDSVDNIPGVKGIGEKTARELIADFKGIENLFKNVDKIKSDKLKALIKENKEIINLSRQLAELPTDINIDFELEDLKLKGIDYDKLYEMFKKLEFKSLLKNLSEKMPEKFLSSDADLFKNIKESNDFNDLKEELTKTKTFSFSLGNMEEGFEIFISTGKNNIYKFDGNNKNNLALIFQNKEFLKIGLDVKNLKFILDKFSIKINPDYFDVMLAAYLIDPARTDYQLAALIFDYLKIGPLSENDLAGRQAIFIYKLKELLEKELKDKNLINLFSQLEMPLTSVLFKMEKNGVKIDKGLLEDLSKNLNRDLNKLIEEIYLLSKREFNINSPKQLREILFNELKLPVVKKTKTGPSTDEEVLRKLSGQHKIPSLILKYRQITKLKSTYIDVLPLLCDKNTDRVHSTFLQTGTETGRLSSSNPNLQNIPIKTELGRQIRRAFIAAAKGWLLLSCDYSQVELRILAHLSGDEALAQAFKNDLDVHKITASLIYQVDVKDVETQMREFAKRINFGVIYGMSAYGLSKDLEISVEVAQGFIDAYFLRYQKVKEFINSQIGFAKENGYVETIMKRRRYLPFINSQNISLRQFSERQAVNTSIQGSAADLIKLAMVNIQNELDKNQMQAKMVLQVHDELVFDFPNQEKDKLVEIAKREMEEAIKLSIPIKVSLKLGLNWAEAEEIV